MSLKGGGQKYRRYWTAATVKTETYMELVALIEEQRSINARQAEMIIKLVNQCAEMENMIGSLLLEGYCDN